MGGANVDVSKIPQVDTSANYQILSGKQRIGGQYLQGAGDVLIAQAKTPPQMQAFDASKVSQEAAEFGVQNELKSREIRRLIDPSAARMQDEIGSRVAHLTDIQATKEGMDEWAKKQGLFYGYDTGLSAGTIGRSAVYDAATQAGRDRMLRNLQIQQGYLAQTPAPIGGLDPATAIQAEMAAKAANLEAMQRFQQNVFAGGQKLQQSTSDFINQNLGELQQVNQIQQQNKQQREQMIYEAAVNDAARKNNLTGAYIGAGGAVAGAALGAAIMI